MNLKSFEHVLVLADDLAATRDFYVDVVGLEDGPRPDFQFPGHWLYLNGSACVHLAERSSIGSAKTGGQTKPTGEESATGCIDHVAFNAADIDQARAGLDARSISYEHRKVPGGKLQQLFLSDPNGVTVEINFPIG